MVGGSNLSLPSGAWSPDSARIMLVDATSNRPVEELYVVGADGSNLTAVGQMRPEVGDQPYDAPRWSPDGSRIAFVSWGVASEYQGAHCLGDEDDRQPSCKSRRGQRAVSWSPDSRFLAVAAYDSKKGAMQIAVVGADGAGDGRVLAEGEEPNWSPAGDVIALKSRPKRGTSVRTRDRTSTPYGRTGPPSRPWRLTASIWRSPSGRPMAACSPWSVVRARWTSCRSTSVAARCGAILRRGTWGMYWVIWS